MKQIEKLAHDYSRKWISAEIARLESTDDSYATAYIYGFQKARELAADHVARMVDGIIRNRVRKRFLQIGEEEE